MTIKKTAISTSIVLAVGLSLPLFAQTEGVPTNVVDGDAVTIECIPQAEADAMNPTDREKLTLPICEATDGGTNKEDTKAPTQ
jgi:hypothetical protein